MTCIRNIIQIKMVKNEIIITATGPPSNALDIINSALDKFEQEIYLSENIKVEKGYIKGYF